jgi:hypothetical protein
MRIPIGVDLESRDGGVTKDARTHNGILEPKAEGEYDVLKRPGMDDLGAVHSGTAQMLAYFNSRLISIMGNSIDRSPLPISVTNIGADGTATVGITRVGAVATVTQANHGFVTGDTVTISGAVQPEYNGTYTITVTLPSTYTYAVSGAPATPATGTVVATQATTLERWYWTENGLSVLATGYMLFLKRRKLYRLTETWTLTIVSDTDLPINDGTAAVSIYFVPGPVFLDGYFFVMDTAGRIWNSTLDVDPTAWLPTAVVSAEKESGAGVALNRTLDYVVAFKEYTTELFYDAANPTGSPLSPVDNGYFQIGCASGQSVAPLAGSVFWIGTGRSKGRSIQKMRGLDHAKISTPGVERILNADDLATVYAYGITVKGHDLYVLTLVTSNITLVYDDTAGKWTTWSSYTLSGSSSTVSSITRSGTTATVTCSAPHGFSDGDPVKIAGADQADYNGIFQVSGVTLSAFTIQVANSPVTPATGAMTATGYTESYFKFTQYVNAGGRDVFLHASDGHAYEMLTTKYQDAGIPVNLFGRSIRLDGGSYAVKKLGDLALVGDKVSDYVVVRWSDDDSGTFTKYRNVDLSKPEPRIRRCGSFKRRSFEYRHIGNNPIRLSAFDLGVSQ